MTTTERATTAAGDLGVSDMVTLDARPSRARWAGEVPAGWEVLPAGVTRKVRVNVRFTTYGSGGGRNAAFLIETGGEKVAAKEVRFGEVPELKSGEKEVSGCGSKYKPGSVWVETDGPLLIRR